MIDPHILFTYGIDIILLGSLILLEIHIYKSYNKPKIAIYDAVLLNIVAIPTVHSALYNNLIGMDLFFNLLAPILAFLASAALIIVEIKVRKR